MPKKTKQSDLLQEINNENSRVDEFISQLNAKIKKTDAKLAKAIMADDIQTVKLYQKILQS